VHDVTVVRALHGMLLMSRSGMVVGAASCWLFIVPRSSSEPCACHWVIVEHDAVSLYGVCACSAWSFCVDFVSAYCLELCCSMLVHAIFEIGCPALLG
jgi:hypothetical protein